MGALDNIRDVVKLAQTVGNAELYQKLNAVQMDLMELFEKVRQLQEENRELGEKLRQKARMDELRDKRTLRHNAYWVGDDGPYCTGCWDGKDRPVHMTRNPDTGYGACPICKHEVCYDPNARAGHSSRKAHSYGVDLPGGGYLPPGY